MGAHRMSDCCDMRYRLGGVAVKFDLKTPCKNCPFRTDKTGIRFACRERAEEIEESAYRNGFPCHLSAHDNSDEDDENGGYVATENSQHCVGYIIMQIKEGYDSAWPGINNDYDLLDKLTGQVNLDAPVFENSDDFFKANSKELNR